MFTKTMYTFNFLKRNQHMTKIFYNYNYVSRVKCKMDKQTVKKGRWRVDCVFDFDRCELWCGGSGG